MKKYLLIGALLVTAMPCPPAAAQYAGQPFSPPPGTQQVPEGTYSGMPPEPQYSQQPQQQAPSQGYGNADTSGTPYMSQDSSGSDPYYVDTDTDAVSRIQYADNGRVRFISGGVDDEGMRTIDAQQNDYNLKLMFVGKSGEYLADVDVEVADRSGNDILTTTTDGPVLLAHLPPGNYTVTATSDDVTRKQHISVGKKGKHLATSYMRFPSES
jgi:hypothetical protein